jgi:hypothetical protein
MSHYIIFYKIIILIRTLKGVIKMNKLTKMIIGVIAMATLSVSPLMAERGDLSGPYLGLSAQVNGVAIDGSHTALADGVGDTTDGTIGAFALVGGVEVGYAIPLGARMAVDLGVSVVPGKATLRTGTTDTVAANTSRDVTFSVRDFTTFYIAPTVSLSDTSSIYVKYGASEAQTKTEGDYTDPGDLDGTTLAVGTKSTFASGLYLRSEAGYTSYDKLEGTGQGGSIPTTTSFSAEPTLAYGNITLGFQF